MSDYDWYKTISEMAYAKWEQAGKPEGQDERFWYEAIEEYRILQMRKMEFFPDE